MSFNHVCKNRLICVGVRFVLFLVAGSSNCSVFGINTRRRTWRCVWVTTNYRNQFETKQSESRRHGSANRPKRSPLHRKSRSTSPPLWFCFFNFGASGLKRKQKKSWVCLESNLSVWPELTLPVREVFHTNTTGSSDWRFTSTSLTLTSRCRSGFMSSCSLSHFQFKIAEIQTNNLNQGSSAFFFSFRPRTSELLDMLDIKLRWILNRADDV